MSLQIKEFLGVNNENKITLCFLLRVFLNYTSCVTMHSYLYNFISVIKSGVFIMFIRRKLSSFYLFLF